MLSKHLKQALQKPAEDARIIFIDVNTKFENSHSPAWVERAGKKMDMKENTLNPDQVAYVFVTNIGFHWDLNCNERGHGILGHGLGITDFGNKGSFRLTEIYRQKQSPIDGYNIMESFRTYPKIPSTFDGSLLSERFNDNPQRLIIGETYFFNNVSENGLVATVTTATLDGKEENILIGTDTGDILSKPITEDELYDYKNHRDYFFGVEKKQRKESKGVYEFFEQLVDIHLQYSKNKIFKLIEPWPDVEELKKLCHEDLVLEYCERIAGQIDTLTKQKRKP